MTALDRYLQELARIQSVSRGGSSNPLKRLDLQQGTVIGIHLGGVDVLIRGDLEPVPRVRYLSSYIPGFGDLVWLLTWGTDRLVLGDLTVLPTANALSSTIENWHEVGTTGEPAFQNGWVSFDAGGASGHTTPAFAMQSDGWCRMKGIVKNGSPVNSIMFTMPPEYRPPFLWGGIVLGGDANAAVNISVNGTVHAVQGGSAAYVSLDGIAWPTKDAWERDRDALWFPIQRARAGWIADNSDVNLFPMIYRRPDGWRYIKGNVRNGSAGVGVGVSMELMPEDTIAYSEVLCGREDGVGMIRFDLNGQSGDMERTTKTNLTVMVGNHYFARRGENFFGIDPTYPHKSMQVWTDVTFLNGWRNFSVLDDQWRNVQYFRDDFGIVHIRGMALGDLKTGLTVFQLPPGYRPAAKTVFGTTRAAPPNPGQQGRVNVFPNGDVECSLATADWHSLSSIAFKAEQ